MIAYIFIFLAGFFNACMDAFENENYFESIFKSWNQKFWYKRESWKYVKKIFGYHLDAWHISKTLMIGCIPAFGWCYYHYSAGSWWLCVINSVVVWNGSFKLFYNVLFGIK
jgi:hypothetical protein